MSDQPPKPVYTPPPPPVEMMATVGDVTKLANRLETVEQRLASLELHVAPLIGLDERFASVVKSIEMRLTILEEAQPLNALDGRVRALEDPRWLAWVEARLQKLESTPRAEDARGA